MNLKRIEHHGDMLSLDEYYNPRFVISSGGFGRLEHYSLNVWKEAEAIKLFNQVAMIWISEMTQDEKERRYQDIGLVEISEEEVSDWL